MTEVGFQLRTSGSSLSERAEYYNNTHDYRDCTEGVTKWLRNDVKVPRDRLSDNSTTKREKKESYSYQAKTTETSCVLGGSAHYFV